jgi:hypothetical protein
MEKSSQIAWKIVPLRHFTPLKVVPLIEVLLFSKTTCSRKACRANYSVAVVALRIVDVWKCMDCMYDF